MRRGQVVALVLPQRPETAVAHIALQMLGAVAMPLSMLFGPDALAFRLQDSAAVAAIVDSGVLPLVQALQAECPALRTLLVVGAPGDASEGSWRLALKADPRRFRPVATRADDAAILIYTSGTTGPPKGALIPQRALLGNLSGFVCSQNWFGTRDDEVFWSPADWAWTGGLMDALLPTLYFGRRIVAFQGRFQPERAFELMAAPPRHPQLPVPHRAEGDDEGRAGLPRERVCDCSCARS